MSLPVGAPVCIVRTGEFVGVINARIEEDYEVKRPDGSTVLMQGGDIALFNATTGPTIWEMLATNQFEDPLDFGISTTVSKVFNTSSNTISTLKSSRTLFKPYQIIPLIKFFQSERNRILIADEVGLGKTIEAGHILLEMAGRKLMRNCLIICTKSLQIKWQTEMQDKFFYPFDIYETGADFANRLRKESQQMQRPIFGIVTYDKLLNEDVQEALSQYTFDLVICDEAHKVRNHETQRFKALSRLLDSPSAAVFLTATPMMTSLENLYNLLRLLEPSQFSDYRVFANLIELNRPFLRALSQLSNREPFSEICQILEQYQVRQQIQIGDNFNRETFTPLSELLGEDALYFDVLQKLKTQPPTSAVVAAIQQDLIHLNSLSSLYTRTRRRHIQTDGEAVVIRQAHAIRVSLSPVEEAEYEEVFEGAYDLGSITRKRMMASCIPAFSLPSESIDDYLEGMEFLPDSKFDDFLPIVQEVVGSHHRKLIVFSFFKKTLHYLQARLRRAGFRPILLHGDVRNRNQVLDAFRDDLEVQILLSSEVGSEGLDLQFCDALVNYDLPWNPMVVEQRIGRIDRVGQSSPIIHIYNFILTDTIEELIFERLLSRIDVFRESIGDLEEILGDSEHPLADQLRELETTLYTRHLTRQEQEKLIDNVAVAIQTESLMLSKIEKDLQDAVVNDFYLKEEISRVVSNRRYLGERELLELLHSLIRRHLTTLTIVEAKPGLEYDLISPPQEADKLYRFIDHHLPSQTESPELRTLFYAFRNLHRDSQRIRFTLNQQYAFERPNVTFISAYHPLIQAAARYFQKNKLTFNQTYLLAIEQYHLQDLGIGTGYYLLLIANIVLKKSRGTAPAKEVSFLQPVTIDLSNSEPEALHFLDDEVAGQFWGRLMDEKRHLAHEMGFYFNQNLVDALRVPMLAHLQKLARDRKEQEQLVWDSQSLRQRNTDSAFLKARLDRIEDLLRTGRGIERVVQKDRQDVLDQLDRVERDFQERYLESVAQPLTLSIIQVF